MRNGYRILVAKPGIDLIENLGISRTIILKRILKILYVRMWK
jgi:hypothetical protein